MHLLPEFTAPTRHRDAREALAQVDAIYRSAIAHLRSALNRYVQGELGSDERVRAHYPLVRFFAPHNLAHGTPGRLSYGFVAGPGRYETTLTRPDLYASYYLRQFELLLLNHGGEIEVGTSTLPIPIHFSFAEHDHVEGSLNAQRRALMREVFDLPDLAVMDDGIANGTHEPGPGEAQPLSLFT
ncbi:MAG: AMP nucleosidase, partial [Burkholderiaceae bacterium]|nr:AMP nucleosidase [Burkholderiaceae bacterium]